MIRILQARLEARLARQGHHYWPWLAWLALDVLVLRLASLCHILPCSLYWLQHWLGLYSAVLGMRNRNWI